MRFLPFTLACRGGEVWGWGWAVHTRVWRRKQELLGQGHGPVLDPGLRPPERLSNHKHICEKHPTTDVSHLWVHSHHRIRMRIKMRVRQIKPTTEAQMPTNRKTTASLLRPPPPQSPTPQCCVRNSKDWPALDPGLCTHFPNSEERDFLKHMSM